MKCQLIYLFVRIFWHACSQVDLMWLMQPFLEKDGWHYIGGEDPMEQIPMDDPETFLEMFEKEAKELRKLNMSMIRSRYVLSRLALIQCALASD